MSNALQHPDTDEVIEIDLRQPGLAALFAWLIPGAGHVYQGRYGKGILFMVCILTTYFFGLSMGKGHVVYASWTKTDKRWHYLCQVGVGVPALPALVQGYQVIVREEPPLMGGFMAPPRQPVIPGGNDQLASWNKDLNSRFEMGVLYTMIAGLLNILAIYDAYAGPFVPAPNEESDKPPPDEDS